MSITSTLNAARLASTLSQNVAVSIPNIVSEGTDTRQDALVYSVIDTLDEGTDPNTGREGGGIKGITWALPPPIDIIDMHSANWEGINLAEAKVAQQAMVEGQEAGSGIMQGVLSAAETLAKQTGNLVSLGLYDLDSSDDLLGQKVMMGQGNIYNQFSLATRTSINPNTEMAFRGANLRQMQFQYRFIPYDQKVSETIKKLIDDLRKNMYAKTNDVWRSGYPAKYAISVKTNPARNGQPIVLFSMGNGLRFGEKIGCSLLDVQVGYGESGTYAGHYDGTPSIINLNLTFQENIVSTRESIEQEYEYNV